MGEAPVEVGTVGGAVAETPPPALARRWPAVVAAAAGVALVAGGAAVLAAGGHRGPPYTFSPLTLPVRQLIDGAHKPLNDLIGDEGAEHEPDRGQQARHPAAGEQHVDLVGRSLPPWGADPGPEPVRPRPGHTSMTVGTIMGRRR
jgi:hypothetical protein